MLIRKGEANIFITDESIGIYQHSISKNNLSVNKIVELEKHIIENGYIVEPETLLLKLKTLFKQNDIKPKSINMVIHDQNLLIRELVIKKENLLKKSILNYLHDQTGKSIHFPFDEANISYYTKTEDELTVTVVVAITDENLLQDYHDIFDRLGVKSVSFNIAPSVLYRLYETETQNHFDQAMIVSVFNNMITIHVLENGVPVFGMIEDYEDTTTQYVDMIENYIERVSNYYRYNIKKGEISISNILVFNFSNHMTNKHLKSKLKPELENLNLVVYESKKTGIANDELTENCIMAYAAGVVQSKNQEKPFNLSVERIKRINQYANYLMVLSFAIFSAVALIYIPFLTLSEDINIQTNINNILQNQLDALQADTPEIPTYSDLQRDYSNSYDYLFDQVDRTSGYFEDLLSHLDGSLEVISYSFDANDNEINILISATSEAELYEYLIVIYEAYGLNGEADSTHWMTAQPQRRFISSLLMEVTIQYA
ncbi:MAG: hypothetical protein ABH890_05610 [Bacillota bacterium]